MRYLGGLKKLVHVVSSTYFGLLAVILLPLLAGAQYNRESIYWRNERQSVTFGAGVANFLGELGGRDEVGRDFYYDLEMAATRPALMVNYKYRLTYALQARADLGFAMLSGNDNLTREPFRRNRNIHFRSPVLELALGAEYTVYTFRPKDEYGTDAYMRQNPKGTSLYVFGGVGGIYFNPQGEFRGDWVNLRDLGTEGQLQPGGGGAYSRFTVVVPFGAGVRYIIDKNWSIGLEFNMRKTFTDYLDDTSTEYFDNDLIRQTQGDLAAYFADPSLGVYEDPTDGSVKPLNSTFPGAQRGDPDDLDAYFTTVFTAQYKIETKRFRKLGGRKVRSRTKRVLF